MPTFDAVSGAYTTNGTPGTNKTGNHTIGGGSNRLLLIGIFLTVNTTTVSSVKFNGSAVGVVAVGSIQSNPNGAVSVVFYRIKEADLPSAGTYTMDVTVDTSQEFSIAGISYSDVDQTSPISGWTSSGHNVFGAGSQDPSVTVSSATGDLVVDMVMTNIPGTETCGQTERLNSAPWNYRSCFSEKAGAASVTMNWTSSTDVNWVDAGLSLAAVSAAVAGCSTMGFNGIFFRM